MVNQQPTQEQLESLWGVCVSWIEHAKPTCQESLLQVDQLYDSLPTLAEDVCDIVGYYQCK